MVTVFRRKPQRQPQDLENGSRPFGVRETLPLPFGIDESVFVDRQRARIRTRQPRKIAMAKPIPERANVSEIFDNVLRHNIGYVRPIWKGPRSERAAEIAAVKDHAVPQVRIGDLGAVEKLVNLQVIAPMAAGPRRA